MGHRMSSLPLAQFCPMAPQLDALHSESGRSAVVSTAFHALCSDPDSPETHRKLARLTPTERDEVDALHKPTALEIDGLPPLKYSDSSTEVELTLPLSDGTKSIGHADMVWELGVNGHAIIVVGDIKRSAWTTPDGPNTLQLLAYAVAAVANSGAADYLYPALWLATEGRWVVGQRIDWCDPIVEMELWERIDAAATHKGQASTGPHCSSCYSRVHCPAYLLPGAIGDANPDLAPLTTGKATADEALRALQAIQAMETIASQGKELLKAWTDVHGPISEGDKEWGPKTVKGRTSFNSARFKKDHPELAAAYTITSKPSVRYAWHNRRA